MDLTNAQWAKLKPLFEPKTPPRRRGRPWTDTRQVLNGVLWILRTGAPRRDLSSALSTLATLRGAAACAAEAGRGLTRPRQVGSIGSLPGRQFQQGQKGGAAVGYDRRGKGSQIMAITDRHGLPLAVHLARAGA